MAQSEQTYFDDLSVGDSPPPRGQGPLTTAHLMRWSAAIENWHKIHYDRPFSVEHDELPDLLVQGTLKQQLVVQLLKDWAGPKGWLWKVRFQFRAMNLVGETLTVWAKVIEMRTLEEYGLVDLELGVRNDEDSDSTPGSATVALPYRERGRVPYPFEPPVLRASAQG